MLDDFYTHSEKNDLKYTVGFALASAERRLRSNNFKGGVCTNALRGRALTDKITLREVNKIADRIVDDSYYFDNGL